MKQLFTLLAFFLFTNISQAQIQHIDYGEGWSVPINSNTPFDINNDGNIDFHINKYEDELGFSPEFIIGCIAGSSDAAIVSFGAREMRTFDEGEIINGTDLGFDIFIDDGRGSNWHRNYGFAEGWNDNEEKYIGFILLGLSNGPIEASNGWMKIKIDAANEALIILELAYEEALNVPITTGSITTSINALPLVESLKIAPNPASDLLNISFENVGSKILNIAICNDLGQNLLETNTSDNKGKTTLNMDVSSLNNGSYYVVISNNNTTRTERFTVSR